MFFPLIFPQFIDFNSNYIVQFFILITTYVVLDFLSLIAYAILARKLIVWIKANPKVINTISACVLILNRVNHSAYSKLLGHSLPLRACVYFHLNV